MKLIKPRRLTAGDTIATVSVSHGWAGEPNTVWKYNLGKKRLEEMFNLRVIAAPNSMKGFEYLRDNPKTRAEDIMWAFENKNVSAIIANVGGNDSIKLIPFINDEIIKRNPKIFIGYSDVMNIHLLCYKSGLSSFYGHNFLTTISEAQAFHKYSEKWFNM
ncbi:MAG: LD-carboxypeptidase [Clostridiales bacterium]|jgi:muramoyltetrapeptide carboxypeptidase LdcA involved in peptidoglycan recycling|nr:LD-carboxypeptidase [Clostridiales bacterium]